MPRDHNKYRFSRLLALIAALLWQCSLFAATAVLPNSAPLTWSTGAYAYDAGDNVIAIGDQYFVYDSLSRITTGHVGPQNAAVTQSYTYDPYGNMRTMTGYGVDQTIDVAEGTNHVVGTDYDEDGNVVKASVYQYEYDAVGMITRITAGTAPSQVQVSYVYTADDERLATIAANETHVTIRGLGGAVLTDLNVNRGVWSLTRDYVYRQSAMLATTSPVNALYYSADHLGSPRLVSDDYGVKAAFQTFLPYGQELAPISATDGANKKFTGHERDADPANSGNPLDYMHARYYSGLAGRFLSFDPYIDLKSAVADPRLWNRYAYVSGNPLTSVDPKGLYQINCGNLTASQCKAWTKTFQAALHQAKFQTDDMKLKHAANAFGDDNGKGVIVVLGGQMGKQAPAETVAPSMIFSTLHVSGEGQLDYGPSRLVSATIVRFRGEADITAENLVHEGSHADHAQTYLKSFNGERFTWQRRRYFQEEWDAFEVSAAASTAWGQTISTPSGNSLTPQMSWGERQRAITAILKAEPYHVTDKHQGGYWP